MKKALMLAPMGSVHRRFNKANIEALQGLGYQVELAANFENGEGPEVHNQQYAAECKEKGILTHSIPFERHSLIGSLKCMPQVRKLLKDGAYDIVHAHTETGGLILRLANSVKGKSRFFYTPHGMSFWKGSSLKSQLVYRPMERWICSGMDMNLGMNQEEVDVLQKWNSKTATYVHGIGLNLERFQIDGRPRNELRAEFGVTNGEKLIVSVGELDDNKNHSTVIKALSVLEIRSFKYVVCGVGPNKDMLTKIAADAGLSDKVILAGYRSDIPDILNAADLFVFPSFHEGMPVSALEAMASGLPIICSSIRGNVDIINDGDNGFLFKPTEVKKLAERISYLLDRKDERKRMGARNRVLVEKYSMARVTNELQCIYSSFN
jgi:glycosyltransferase involved in cell wall biosynthesis